MSTSGLLHGMRVFLNRNLRRRAGAGVVTPGSVPGTGHGTPREPVSETTNLGPVIDSAVTRARGRMLPAGIDPDYDLAYEHFDIAHFYLQARGLLENERVDPLRHFLGNGAEAKASPDVNFDMRSYLSRHPRRARSPEQSPYLEWLKRGRLAGEIADPAPSLEEAARVLGLPPGELAAVLAATRSDVRDRLRTGALGAMFARAAEVEPLIGETWRETTRPQVPPLVSDEVVGQISAIHASQEGAGFERARLVLVITRPRWGGGRRIEGHLAHALAGHVEPREIVIVYTDASGAAPPGRYPAGVREVDLAASVANLDRQSAQRVLVELLQSFHADAVVNINSELLYGALTAHGRELAGSERIFLMLFCNEQLATGHWVGLPLRYFYRCFDVTAGVLTDSGYLADWLRERHQLGGEQGQRIHVLRAPVDPGLAIAGAPPPEPTRRPQVFWAGRWDRQKRIGLVLDIARRMPDIDFRMWGEAVLTRGNFSDVPDNVRIEGRYGHISELALSEADLWLYTSAWDGVPSLLLEVAMTEIPLVGSLVGGTGEVLTPDESWPIVRVDEAAAYEAAIRDVLTDPSRARARSRALRERLLRERTGTAFGEQVAALLLDPRAGGEDTE